MESSMGQRTRNKLQNPLENATRFWDHLLKTIQKCMYCSTKPKCWTARNGNPAAFHILLSCQHGKVALLMPIGCSHLFSPEHPFTGAVRLNRSTFLNPSQHSDHSLQLFNIRAVTTVKLESGCKSCLDGLWALSVPLCVLSPSRAHIRLIAYPVSCAVPNAPQNEQRSIPNHSLLLKIDVCH